MLSLFRIRKTKFFDNSSYIALRGLLCVVLLFVQSTGVSHSHAGELQAQYECEICLKSGSNEDISIVEEHSLRFCNNSQKYISISENRPYTPALTAKSRSPPIV